MSYYAGPSGAFPASGKVELVYPSHDDVINSYDGPLGGGCLPYSKQTHSKQPWLWDHMIAGGLSLQKGKNIMVYLLLALYDI